MSGPILSIAGLRVWFGHPPDRVDAVRGVDLEVQRGDSFGLVGESGSGKSTVLRAIAGLAPDWSGRIWVVSTAGMAITVDPATGAIAQRALGEPVGNSFAVDETGGVFVVTDSALYRPARSAPDPPPPRAR